jgi:hydrogenase maturation protein HypF
VRGTVQGVGFRPFVYRQATSLSLFGWVGNSDQGVTVEVEGETLRIEALLTALQTIPPVHAHIVSIETQEIAPRGETGFTIRSSTISSTQSTEITPDLATCDDCLRELLDQQDRRHLYPFINCTNCGPRYTIVEAIPYDRARTSMRHFPMCEVCQAEYDNPADRRFHAEPNACPDCGPRLALWDTAGTTRADDHAALTGAAQALRQGQIVAVKGIGGFHLLVDATNQTAVSRLRQRKQRDEKPFAAMFPSLAAIAACCDVGPVEAAALSAPPRPIVLLPGALGGTGKPLAGGVAAICAPTPFADAGTWISGRRDQREPRRRTDRF